MNLLYWVKVKVKSPKKERSFYKLFTYSLNHNLIDKLFMEAENRGKFVYNFLRATIYMATAISEK